MPSVDTSHTTLASVRGRSMGSKEAAALRCKRKKKVGNPGIERAAVWGLDEKRFFVASAWWRTPYSLLPCTPGETSKCQDQRANKRAKVFVSIHAVTHSGLLPRRLRGEAPEFCVELFSARYGYGTGHTPFREPQRIGIIGMLPYPPDRWPCADVPSFDTPQPPSPC